MSGIAGSEEETKWLKINKNLSYFLNPFEGEVR